MSDMPEHFIFELSHPIKIDINGANQEIFNVKITAPSNRSCEDQCIILQKGLFKAIKEVQGYASSDQKSSYDKDTHQVELTNNPDVLQAQDSDPKDMGVMLVQALLSADSVDMTKLRRNFKTLITSGCCILGDTNVALTGFHYNLLSYRDTNKMLGEYLATFLLGMI